MAAVETSSGEQLPQRWLLALQAVLLEFEAAKLPWSADSNPSSAFGSPYSLSLLLLGIVVGCHGCWHRAEMCSNCRAVVGSSSVNVSTSWRHRILAMYSPTQ